MNGSQHPRAAHTQKKGEGRTPVQERSQKTKKAIVLGAATAFDQKGYAATSLKDISIESNISLGSIYFYFQNKDQIAHAVIHEQHTRSYALIKAKLDQEYGPFEQLIEISRAVVDQLLSDIVVRAGFRLGMDEAALQDAAADFYEEWARGAQIIVERAQRDAVLRSAIPAPAISRLLVGFFTGTQLMSQATSKRLDLLDMVRVMWILVIDGLVAESHTQRLYEFVESNFAEGSRLPSETETTNEHEGKNGSAN
ncbi:ScbR family autoregulator-binding transcription factor [Auritidibacter ignavus]|uniref:ScbR family autoregulator-binding transcription factor n=1 Tax=Auritidibacter ignavus TaxID=678932 RepID=UPI00109CBD8D|nr:ScbR family autoregulator-binding transcription factor [Auritidibacter ignavus]